MRQAGDRLDLGEESVGSEGRGHFGPQDFHRDVALVLEVERTIDRRHAATTEHASQLVSGGERADEIGRN
jgi:hypothetical protein